MTTTRRNLVAILVLTTAIICGGPFLLTPAPLNARAPLPPTTPEARLDFVLRRWHEALNRIETASCDVVRTYEDTTFNKREVFQGTFKYIKNIGTRLELSKRGSIDKIEKIVHMRESMYLFDGQLREIRVYHWPSLQRRLQKMLPGWDVQDALFFGLDPKAARQRFDWQLTKEDNDYIYLEVEPRVNEDKASLLSARLVLEKGTFLPRQVWFRQSNDARITWEIRQLQTGVNLKQHDIAPKWPDGWRLIPPTTLADSPS